MGETIEDMLNVLQSHINFLEDKIEYNNLDLHRNLEQFKNIKDKDEKQRILYILEHLKIDAEHYINKIK